MPKLRCVACQFTAHIIGEIPPCPKCDGLVWDPVVDNDEPASPYKLSKTDRDFLRCNRIAS